MIEVFLSTIGRARSENMLNLAIIDALNWMTPDDAFALHKTLSAPAWRFPGDVPEDKRRRFTDVTRAGVSQTFQLMQNAGKPRTERFRQERLEPGLRFYRGAKDSAGRTLVVAFPGNGGRLMMPLPIILQNLAGREVDLLMVPDGFKMNYRKGVKVLGPTAADWLPALRAHLPTGYERLVTFGTSSGGVPSLLAAAALGADTALAVGAGHPDDQRWNESVELSKRQLLEAARPGLADAELTLAYGAQIAEDETSAQAIAGIVPHARVERVALPGFEIKHVALIPLAKTGRLGGFLAARLRLGRHEPGAALTEPAARVAGGHGR